MLIADKRRDYEQAKGADRLEPKGEWSGIGAAESPVADDAPPANRRDLPHSGDFCIYAPSSNLFLPVCFLPVMCREREGHSSLSPHCRFYAALNSSFASVFPDLEALADGLNPLTISQTARTISCTPIGAARGM